MHAVLQHGGKCTPWHFLNLPRRLLGSTVQRRQFVSNGEERGAEGEAQQQTAAL